MTSRYDPIRQEARTARYNATSPEVTPIPRTNGASVPNTSIERIYSVFGVKIRFIVHQIIALCPFKALTGIISDDADFCNRFNCKKSGIPIITILENNKYTYEGRYQFPLNRFVDSETKGSFNQDGLTVKVYTQFTGFSSDTDFGAESARSSSLVVDLTEGTFIDELIRANKIATFKRNNSASMSASLTEIMSKKSAEYSDRVKRAEDIIRNSLRNAPIYLNGTKLPIGQKDGKDRLQDGLKAMVKQEYYKLGLVSYFYQDQRSILTMLNQNEGSIFTDDGGGDANKGAYDEIYFKLDNDKALAKNVTVKSLVDYFGKKPFGWRDLDILGMLGQLWKYHTLEFFIHENLVDERNGSFKNDFVRKNNIDTMVVRRKIETDPDLIYNVKRLMNEVYSENYPLEEGKVKDGVIAFFDKKKTFLSGLKTK